MAAKKKGRAERRFAPTVSRLLVGLVMFFVMFTLLSAAITPERYDIQIGQPAPNTIKAAKDVEDIITTEKLRNDAANNVRSVYSVDENAKDTVLQTLSGRLDVVEQVANLYLPPEDGKSEVTEAQLSTANQQLAPVEITSDELVALGAAEEKTLDAIMRRAEEFVSETMDNNLRESEIDASVQKIKDALLQERYSRLLVSVICKAVRASLQPNYFYDEAATESARQTERDKVETVTRIKGEVIVSDGEIVTEAQYEMLKALGMIKEGTLDISLYYGVALLIVLLLTTGSLYLYLFEEKTFKSLRTLVLICVVCVVEMGASLLVREVTPYLMPSTSASVPAGQPPQRHLPEYCDGDRDFAVRQRVVGSFQHDDVHRDGEHAHVRNAGAIDLQKAAAAHDDAAGRSHHGREQHDQHVRRGAGEQQQPDERAGHGRMGGGQQHTGFDSVHRHHAAFRVDVQRGHAVQAD